MEVDKIQKYLLKNGWEDNEELRTEKGKNWEYIVLQSGRKENDKLQFEAYLVNDEKTFEELRNKKGLVYFFREFDTKKDFWIEKVSFEVYKNGKFFKNIYHWPRFYEVWSDYSGLKIKDLIEDGGKVGISWKKNRFGDLLDYFQPKKYTVKDENYKNLWIPVLTAWKTYLLWFNDSQENYFDIKKI